MMKQILLISLLLTAFAVNSIFPQSLFEGRLTYSQKMSGIMASETKFVEYYKGGNVACDIPDLKSKLIYMADRQELVSIQSMMATPVVTKKTMLKGSDDTPILFSDTIVRINGYNCLRIEFEIEDEMMQGVSVIWIDTSFRIPFNYGIYTNLEHGLVVKSKSELKMKGLTIQTSKELQDVHWGNVDPTVFALPDEENSIVIAQDEYGNIVYRECDSLKIKEMLTPNNTRYVEMITDGVFEKKVRRGYALLDFGARWCGPCRLLEPRIASVARQYRKKVAFFKMDIDESPHTAKRFGITTVPTIVLLKDGVEVSRFVGGSLAEEEIVKWLLSNMQ